MKKWEYYVLALPKDQWHGSIAEKMKNLGQDGWELVTVVDDISSRPVKNRLHYFKKPLEE